MTARMTLTDQAAKLGLRVEHEPHGAGAGVTLHTVHRDGQWLYQGTAAEAHSFLDGYQAALDQSPRPWWSTRNCR